MEHEVRYCTTEDGVRIAYGVRGQGAPFVQCPTFMDQFSLIHTIPLWDAFLTRLTAGRCLVQYDERGTGLSERDALSFSLDDQVRTLEAVVTAARLRRFVLYGTLLSGPASIAFTARHPRSVSRLILYGTAARMSDIMPWEQLRGLIELARSNWDVASQTISDLAQRAEYPEVGVKVSELWRQSTSGEATAERLTQQFQIDVTDLLPTITAPVLVLHKREDGVVPFALGQHLASQLPRATLVPLEGKAHPEFLDDSPRIIDAVDEFLGRPPTTPDATHGAAVRTVLFTDLVGHTEMMQRLGDAKGRDVLREHERITREILKQHGGTEKRTDGDGFMASFGSVTSAIECAIALQRAFSNLQPPTSNLQIRCGLNAGEPIEEEGDLFGSTVILASRIAAQAGAGEILVPETVRGLLSGKGFMFGDRGEFVPKGFDEGVRLYEVRWHE